MAIKGPKGAHPTLRGWVNPKTGELLKVQKITQAQIDDFFGVQVEGPFESAVEAIEVVEEVPVDLNEDGEIDEFESMTKAQLKVYAEEVGLELPGNMSKTKIIDALKGLSDA